MFAWRNKKKNINTFLSKKTHLIWSYDLNEYSKTCVRQPPLKLTLVVDVERQMSCKGTCHVILLAKLHDMYLYKTDNFFHINHYLKSVSKVAVLHRFYCTHNIYLHGEIRKVKKTINTFLFKTNKQTNKKKQTKLIWSYGGRP